MTPLVLPTKAKYWLIYSITVVIEVLVVSGVFLLFWNDIGPDERTHVTRLGPKIAIYATTVLVANLLLFSSMLRHIFKMYIDPVVKLAEETQLIAVSNAKYRIVPAGGPEVVALTGVINDLADKHISLHTDVQQIVQFSKHGVDEEKRRLEALMAQIPEGVVVCNVDGRILLYNHRAQEILHGLAESERPSTFLGLGRSIFGVVDRQPILHALNFLQGGLWRGEQRPAFNFTTSRGKAQFLRVRMAPVIASDESKQIEGYVLSMADITGRVRADSRRDIFLQSLTIGLQQELGRIRDATDVLVGSEAIARAGLHAHTATIAGSVATLLQQIDQVAVQHAFRLQDPGEPEYILGVDLMNVVRDTLVDKFGLQVELEVENDVWLNMNSYTVVRGVNYLVGQLTKHLEVHRVDLSLAKEGADGYLTVEWHGDPVRVRTIEQWKECPLMLGASGRGPVSLANMLTGRGDVLAGHDAEAASVRFRLDVEKPVVEWKLDGHKEHRPVYYEFDLFDAKYQRADLEDLPLDQLTYVVFDTETTGLDPSGGDEIISIGAIRIVGGKIRREEVFDQLVDPRRSVPLESLKIHEIYPEMLRGMPVISDVLPQFHEFAEGAVLVAHNAAFDMRFLELKQERAKVRFDQAVLDTLLLSAVAHPNQEPHNLDAVAERFGLPIVGRHTALGDAILTAEVLLKLIPLLEAKGIRTLGQAWEASRRTQFAGIRF
ncbi:MAG: PAS domain-containing protein [Deltaproteobacteria bacterium]|nr:PAS domain-containing protein [Deltaproteobacteria bacterium]